jgi:hypothetical protein
MKKIFLITYLFVFSISFSQNNRKAFTLEIAANETQQYKADIPESPYFVKEKILQIYCGEKVYVECEIKNDTIASMKIVEEITKPEKTIEINFIQESQDRKNIMTMLTVKNPFEKKLKYDALMFTPMSTEWQETSIIPIRPKLINFETWPHSIVSLVLVEWRFED